MTKAGEGTVEQRATQLGSTRGEQVGFRNVQKLKQDGTLGERGGESITGISLALEGRGICVLLNSSLTLGRPVRMASRDRSDSRLGVPIFRPSLTRRRSDGPQRLGFRGPGGRR